VSYTPDAPAPAVAELTIGLMFSLLRSIHIANAQMHRGEWKRHFGRRLSEVSVGIIGVGRIGARVLRSLAALGAQRILANDTNPKLPSAESFACKWVDKEVIYRYADVISLHVPLTSDTSNMIRLEHLLLMKEDAVIINTARGGIINEQDLAFVMASGHLGAAAIDVFEEEPYKGELAKIERCLLTSHMGSMSVDCRTRMELEATEEAIRFLRGENLRNQVPQEEYDLRLHSI